MISVIDIPPADSQPTAKPKSLKEGKNAKKEKTAAQEVIEITIPPAEPAITITFYFTLSTEGDGVSTEAKVVLLKGIVDTLASLLSGGNRNRHLQDSITQTKPVDGLGDVTANILSVTCKGIGGLEECVIATEAIIDAPAGEKIEDVVEKVIADGSFQDELFPRVDFIIKDIEFVPPSDVSSDIPSDVPSDIPSDERSNLPTDNPSDIASHIPSYIPCDAPSDILSDIPSDIPSEEPSDVTSDIPSDLPSEVPSDIPSELPSDVPSDAPSDNPSDEQSNLPTDHPSDTSSPGHHEC